MALPAAAWRLTRPQAATACRVDADSLAQSRTVNNPAAGSLDQAPGKFSGILALLRASEALITFFFTSSVRF